MPATTSPATVSFAPNAWVPRFRRRTPKTRFVWLDPPVLHSLLEGTVKTTTQEGVVEWSDGTTSDVTAETSAYLDLEASINACISELGGAVCPKFDSKCPSDATWVNFHRSLKCTSAEDVLVMFNSSERVMHIVDAENGCSLALRKWANLDDRMEFRVFVRNEEIVAISQRSENFFEYDDNEMDSIVEKIIEFYDTAIKGSFPGNYVVDVYIERENVWIIDFDHWGAAKSLLYSWEELNTAHWMSSGRPQFRCAQRCGILPSRGMSDGLPVELRHEDAIGDLIEAARRLLGEQGEIDSEPSSENDND